MYIVYMVANTDSMSKTLHAPLAEQGTMSPLMPQFQQLELQFFRNYASQQFTFDQPTSVIVGPNAQGKTSIIEAINLLATGESFRAERVEEMIQFDQDLARIKGRVIDEKDDDAEQTELELILTRGQVQGKKTALRLYSVNQIRRRKREFTSHFSTVVFRPEDMRLVEGSPSRRRNFMDVPLAKIDPDYARSLTTYEQALIRRNKLLQQVREREQPATVLTYWNLTLIKHGSYLTEQRRKFLDFFTKVRFPVAFSVEYDNSVISEERVAEYIDREIASGHTLIGPHKDDLIVKYQFSEKQPPLDVAAYGSRGQQRLAVLWLKVSEYEFMKEKTGSAPLLLLDDILSELDIKSRAKVMSLLGQGQAIITTTEDKIVTELKTKLTQLQVTSLI